MTRTRRRTRAVERRPPVHEPRPRVAEARGPTLRAPLVLGALFLVAAALRTFASFGDLWMDEVWSLRLVRDLRSPIEVITRVHLDNNHPLNGLWLYLLGDRSPGVLYRLPSILSGIASVALAWLAARRHGARVALLAALLFAFSYPLILYSSEARGYAPAVLFALAAFMVLDEYGRSHRAWQLGLFWAVAGLGFLAHLTVLNVYLALVLWSLYRAAVGRSQALLLDAVACHLPPVLFLAVLYVVDVRYIQIGEGPVYKLWAVVRDTFVFALGAPNIEPLRTIALVGGVALAGAGIVRLRRAGSTEWFFYLSVLFIAPALILVARRPEFIYFRYFLVCLPFFYLLLAQVLAWLWDLRPWGRAAVLAGVVLISAGHLARTSVLLEVGRGQYCAAVRFMGENTSDQTIRVGSDHPFRNRMLLDFYVRCLPSGKRLEYAPLSSNPEWLVTHSQELDFTPPPETTARSTGTRYSLTRSFRYGGVSGWHWFVYRRR